MVLKGRPPIKNRPITVPKRLIFVWADVRGIGGTERRMIEAAKILGERSIEVHSYMLSRTADRPVQNAFRSLNTARTEHGGLIRLYKFWRTIRPDYVLAFGLKPSLVARIVRLPRKRGGLLFTAQNGLDFKSSAVRAVLDGLTRELVDGYIANSSSAAEVLENRKVPRARVLVVPSGIDESWVSQAPRRDKYQRVVMIGNYRPEKNQKFGIDAFLESTSPSTLTVFTDDATELRKHLASRSTSPRVSRVRFVENKRIEPRTFDDFDILLHPSISESLPRTILEALARGCWVIASDVGDVARVVPAGAGEVIREFDLSVYVSALERIAKGDVRPSAQALKVRTTGVYVDELIDAMNQFRALNSKGAATD